MYVSHAFYGSILSRALLRTTNMHRLLHCYTCLCTALLLAACNKQAEPLSPPLAQYFPLDSGLVRVYDVLDSNVSSTDTVVTSYFLRTITGGQESDLLGRSVYFLDRDTASSAPGPYTFLSRWRRYASTTEAERIEGNERVLVLRAPLSRGTTWDGNQFNNRGAETFRITITDTTLFLAGVQLENCIKVQQRLILDAALSEINTFEIYAPGLGLVYRYDRFLTFDFSLPDNLLRAESYIRRDSLVSFTQP